jgi:hypothetical protein
MNNTQEPFSGPNRGREGVSMPALLRWTGPGRALVFVLSATSIWCLLAEFYGIMEMRRFALLVMVPSTLVLIGMAWADRRWGDGRLVRAVVIGAGAGGGGGGGVRGGGGALVAAVAYDVFRLPFVFAREWGLEGIVPRMNLFKVFPRFGAMLLGEPLEQKRYSVVTQLVGWAYHFSTGAMFGVMYMALVGRATRRTWWWGVLFATGLEGGMLLSPYARVFAIEVTGTFVVVTMAAHGVFGAVLGAIAGGKAHMGKVQSSS